MRRSSAALSPLLQSKSKPVTPAAAIIASVGAILSLARARSQGGGESYETTRQIFAGPLRSRSGPAPPKDRDSEQADAREPPPIRLGDTGRRGIAAVSAGNAAARAQGQ